MDLQAERGKGDRETSAWLGYYGKTKPKGPYDWEWAEAKQIQMVNGK